MLSKNYLYQEIKDYLQDDNTTILFIHTDISKGFEVPFIAEKSKFVFQHIELLLNINCDVLMPVYNYDFANKKIFDVVNDISKVGVINEFFRKHYAKWQTPIPFFSVAGTGLNPIFEFSENIQVFDKTSIWEFLYNNNSAIMYYGANFSCTTIIHYVEEISKNLYYRYEKQFEGKIILPNKEIKKIIVKMHVRPLNNYLEYDWVKLENDLYENNIIKRFNYGLTDIKIINTKRLVDFWLQRLNEDRLYFLDKQSVLWISHMLDRINRPFEKTDFE